MSAGTSVLNADCIASRSPMRFMSCEMMASFSSSFFVIFPSCSRSLRFSESAPEEKAPVDVPMPNAASAASMLAVSEMGPPTNMGCCSGPIDGPDGTWNSCGKQLGVVRPDIWDICEGELRSG